MNRKFIKNSNFILRKIFNSNSNLSILKNFIESFLKIEIKEIYINNPPITDGEVNREYGIVDVRIKTKENEDLNVGIQIIDGDYIQNKMFLYYAKIHSNQILYPDNRKIARTITINILDMSFFSTIKYHKVIKIKTNIMNDSILETIEMHLIELPKFDKYSTVMNNKELWTGYMKGNGILVGKAKRENKQINKLDKLLEKYWKEEKI